MCRPRCGSPRDAAGEVPLAVAEVGAEGDEHRGRRRHVEATSGYSTPFVSGNARCTLVDRAALRRRDHACSARPASPRSTTTPRPASTCGKAVFALTQGAVLSGRYEIVSPLGRGGMGRVYKAFDRVMEEHVALKVLRSEFMREPEMSRRFVSEIKLARKIGHRNVCRIHEYGEDGDIRFIAMELISGVTLKEYLRDAPLPPDAAFDVSIQVARGLNAVHELGIIHRDFKTANIMIDEAGVAKLVDFGIAKEVSADSPTPPRPG